MQKNTFTTHNSGFTLVECPRDAMQGWPHFIPTQKKIEYLNSLLKVGFDTLDFGSFVSPKAIPQMADTKEVILKLELNSNTKLLAIIANLRGAEEAVMYNEISYLGFPFSISPTFQLRNTNSTVEQSLVLVDQIQDRCIQHKKELVIYLSMGFGNPYGDPYSEEILLYWAQQMVSRGIQVVSLADTVGLATAKQIGNALQSLIPAYENVVFGVHLHASIFNWQEKMDAALEVGCTRFDGALKGIGGCPMAQDQLVGNMDSSLMIPYLQQKGLLANLNQDALHESLMIAQEIFV